MKITMLYGGQSAEHDISILSAHNIVQQIMFDVYTVQPIYITRQGKWIKGPLLEEPSAFPEQLRLGSAQVESWCDNEKVLQPVLTLILVILRKRIQLSSQFFMDQMEKMEQFKDS